jgi:hypothetical protein
MRWIWCQPRVRGRHQIHWISIFHWISIEVYRKNHVETFLSHEQDFKKYINCSIILSKGFHLDLKSSCCLIDNYYLIKKFLVSDWLTANCDIVISTQWLTKYGFFTFILAKWRQRFKMKKIGRVCAILLWRRESYWLADAIDMTQRRTKELFFFLIQIKYKCLFWIF